MTTARDKMNHASAKLSQDPKAAGQIDAVYKFELSGDGGGTWLASLRGTPTIEEKDGPADCTIRMAASDYVDMLDGQADPQQLFFSGKLQIEGNMELAMKLQTLAGILR